MIDSRAQRRLPRPAPAADRWLENTLATLLLGLRADEQRRLGDRFSRKGFHDTLLRNGSLPISFHRRLLADAASSGRF